MGDEINVFGDESLVTAYSEGKLLSTKCTELKGSDGKPIQWWTANIMINGVIYQNLTITSKCEPSGLVSFEDYEFGFQFIQEMDKRGNAKIHVKIVYVRVPEE